MTNYETYTKDYLFAILISGTDEEKNGALRELCNRYKEISYYSIKRLAEQHTKWRFYSDMEVEFMIKYPSGDRDKLKEIQKLLERADCIYNDLRDSTKEICEGYHNEFTISNCLYFGITACEELLDKEAEV